MARRRVIRKKRSSGESRTLTQSLVTRIRATCGEKSAIPVDGFDDAVTSKVKFWVPSGFTWLDQTMSGGRGIPCGKIMEIYGNEATGKTALSQFFIRQFQKKGGVAVYIDFETSLDQEHLRGYGVDLGNLIYVDVETVEEGFDALLSVIDEMAALQKKQGRTVPVLIVWDSVAMAVPQAEATEKAHGQSHIALLARAMSKGMRKLRRRIAKTNCTVLFTNQTRAKVNVMFGEKMTTPGGSALGFASSIRLRTSILKTLTKTRKKRKIRTGFIIGVWTKKTRFAPPMQLAKLVLTFRNGPDPELSLLEYLRDLSLLRVVAKNMKYVPTDETFPKKQWREFYAENCKKIHADITTAEGGITMDADDLDDGDGDEEDE